MLRLINDVNKESGSHPLNVENDKWFVTYKADGMDTLQFEIQSTDSSYRYVHEEADIIVDSNNRNLGRSRNIFTIKKIDRHSDFITVTCEVNTDDWKAMFYHKYEAKTNAALTDAINGIKPDGWKVIINGTFLKKYDIPEIADKNGLELITAILNVFGAKPYFNALAKELQILNPDGGQDSGAVLREDVNVKNVGYNGNSTSFATRVYAYGKVDDTTKKNLTLESVTGGLEYVQDKMYADKIICYGFTDTSITDAVTLYNKAMDKLNELYQPSYSYTLELAVGASKLTGSSADYQKQLNLFDTVKLVDRERFVTHKVVEYVHYPEADYLDTCTLSAVVPALEKDWRKAGNPDGIWLGEVTQAVADAKKYGGTKNSYGVQEVYDKDGNLYKTTDNSGTSEKHNGMYSYENYYAENAEGVGTQKIQIGSRREMDSASNAIKADVDVNGKFRAGVDLKAYIGTDVPTFPDTKFNGNSGGLQKHTIGIFGQNGIRAGSDGSEDNPIVTHNFAYLVAYPIQHNGKVEYCMQFAGDADPWAGGTSGNAKYKFNGDVYFSEKPYVRGEDGYFYEIGVDKEGNLKATKKTTPTYFV